MKPFSALLGVVAGAMVIALDGTALAANFSLSGSFTQDDDLQLFDFSVGTESTVTFITYSYAGGTQIDGTVIPAGGFDPVFSLFDSAGTLIFQNDDDTSGVVANDPTTGQTYDSLLEVNLAAGDYTLVLAQYGNFINGTNLADGFSQTGNGDFTGDFPACTTGDMFCDYTGDSRTNEWAFDALGIQPLSEPDAGPVTKPTEPTQVPEPTTALAFALAGLGAIVQRRR
ncbi:MAG: DVUA0089 family protein [Cyanobacteria bacterium P01_H01_bin.26]